MLPNDIHHTYTTSPKTGKLHPAGRFLVHDGSIRHIEDYHGLLGQHVPEGLIDDHTLTMLGHPGGGLTIASRDAMRGGHRLDTVPEAELDPLPAPVQPSPKQLQEHIDVKPPSVWHYTRAGHDKPHVLEAKEGKFLLDGNPLEHHEVSTILDNVRTKAGKIRYVRGMAANAPQQIAKMENVFKGLRKADMGPQDALAHLDSVGGDEQTQAAVAALRRHIFEDQMVPGLGSKFAYQEFAKKNVPGTTVVGDANFFKGINDVHGHEAGDAAIKAMGSAWRDASNEVGGKAHRFGGDEFHAHFPTYEHAANFARNLRSKLDQVPPIGGTNKLSMSLGLGHDFHSADAAVYHAKQGKGTHTPATIPSVLAHSLHQNSPGAVPLNEDQLQLHPPAIEQRPPEAGASAPAPAHSVSPPPAA
jgi:diguanylate cyclase (GGDEF)-like protein